MTVKTYMVIEKAGTEEGAKKGWLHRKRATPKAPTGVKLYSKQELPGLFERAQGKFQSRKGDLILDRVALEIYEGQKTGYPMYYLKRPGAIAPEYIIALEPNLQIKLGKPALGPEDIQKWVEGADKIPEPPTYEEIELGKRDPGVDLRSEEIQDRVDDFTNLVFEERQAGLTTSLDERAGQYLRQLAGEGKDRTFLKEVWRRIRAHYFLGEGPTDISKEPDVGGEYE